MNSRMPGLDLSKDIVLTVASTISAEPFTQFTNEMLVNLMHRNISKSNARKKIASLKSLGVLDGNGIPTDLGIKWADSKTRKEATKTIVESVFPPGASDIAEQCATNGDFSSWLSLNGKVTKSVADKNVTAYNTLQSVSENARKECSAQKLRKQSSTKEKPGSNRHRTLYIPKNISKQQFHMIMRATKGEDIDIVMTSWS